MPEPENETTPEGARPAPADSPWRTLARVGRPRATRANVVATLMAVLLGFAIATQVSQNSTRGLETLRSDELVRILDSVQSDNARLAEEISTLQDQRDALLSGAATSEEARRAAAERVDTLGILAGTVGAKGPGVIIRIDDPKRQVTGPVLLDTIEELRDAGAEAMQVGQTRIVASTWFADLPAGGVSVENAPLKPPYVLKVIGDAQTLATAMEIPGGVSETIKRVGATISIERSDAVIVDALHLLDPARYARPVSPSGSATP